MKKAGFVSGLGMLALLLASSALGQEEAPPVSAEMFTANNLWMMVSAGLVFIMNLGFATLESGLTRAKNTTNIMFKNTIIPCIGIVTYALVGFGLMYPGEFNGYLGFSGFGLFPDEAGVTVAYAGGKYTYWTDFLFQAMFAATCATIVSGAVAERVKLSSFIIFSVVFTAFVYPIAGSWKWGLGFLDKMGFYDFAGSTLVHSVGGWGALAGVMMLGPRLGKYTKDGRVNAIPGHSMPLATIGVFLLWWGWFGFNGGSVLSADPAAVSLVLVTTSLAASAGGLSSTFVSWAIAKKPDASMALNGILAGLVGITAGADQMSMVSALLIGAIAGVIVVYAVMFFDRMKMDDPVGALAVHLACGVFGTLAVGMFGNKAGVDQLMTQAIGVVCYGGFALASALAIWGALKVTMGIRVSPEEEQEGLDLGEHGMQAYPDFQQSSFGGGPGIGVPAGYAASQVSHGALRTKTEMA